MAIVLVITGAEADTATREREWKKQGVVFKNYAYLTDFISEINNPQVDNAKNLDVFMPLCNLIEYSNKYFGSIW